jgi:hypothetical protein
MNIHNLLCRLGIHKWSANRGGVRICLRCPAVERRDAILQHEEGAGRFEIKCSETERSGIQFCPTNEAYYRKKAQEKAERGNEIVESEKKTWIDKHGSERLQKGYAKGYRCSNGPAGMKKCKRKKYLLHGKNTLVPVIPGTI